MTAPRPGGGGASSGPLTICLNCPECGAPLETDHGIVTATCGHCGSLLILQAGGGDPYVCERMIRREGEVLEAIVFFAAQAHRAEIVSSAREGDREPSEQAIEKRLAKIEEDLRRTARLDEASLVHVPYWHLTGSIVEGILGRRRNGTKEVSVRSFTIERTEPGYDATAANFRDRGLRLARSRVHPLKLHDVEELGGFVGAQELRDGVRGELERQSGQTIDGGIDPIARHGAFLPQARLLVYRPYWLARARVAAEARWILLDATFGLIAGYPSASEAGAFRKLACAPPLVGGGARVLVVPSRCPDCGADQRVDPTHHAQVCASCHRALLFRGDGIDVASYVCEPTEGSDYVPFWRFELSIAAQGAPASRTLDEYAKAAFPDVPSFRPRGDALFVPAVRLLGTEVGDHVFKSVVAAIHASPPELGRERVPITAAPTFWGVTIPAQEARALAPFVLLALHGDASAARIDGRRVRKYVFDARTELSEPGLVFLPFQRAGDALERSGVRVPLLLLRGGPLLDAQRSTVARARSRSRA